MNADITFFQVPLGEGAAAVLGSLDAICLMRERTPFPGSLIEQLPGLKLLVTTGPRNLVIGVDTARAQGVIVCGTRSRKTTTSESTLTLLLALSRRLLPEVRSLSGGGWQGKPGRDLAGRRLGLVGLGNIGGQMAKFRQRLGMDVSSLSPNLNEERARTKGVRFAGV